MATHETFNIAPFWDDEYKHLTYKKEQFNDPSTLIDWEDRGFRGSFGGHMCDMRSPQPSWNQQFIDFFASLGWKDIGTSYYRMDTGSMLPEHVDTFKKYIDIFNLKGQEHTIRRAVVFLEPWQSGHYAECNGVPYVDWIRGFCLHWTWDSPHIATNMGTTPRYTLQVTGHI
ncbi:hypothetical protein UFOVP257_190 [uncultured Caudovirales phage]|uniref:Uncharacterized protein n=1 Tax=uncultured Caudovirales phage TaxID=2100421 RepID=A0A6J5LJC7_9CAUD|nr:hypothetical protein UFOVP257_190 [uncultured Caudovirales phage]